MRITVTGTSRIKVPAERAHVTFTVSRRGPEPQQVIDDVSAASQEVRTLLDELTPDDDGDEPHLSGLRTWTEFAPDQPPMHIAHIDGEVRVWEFGKLGAFLARLAAVDGVTVNAVQWRLTRDTRDAEEPAAIRDAFQDARQRARWIAAAAGHDRVTVVSVADGGVAPAVHPRQAFMRSEAAASLELDPQDIEIAVSLVVEFDASSTG